MASPSVPSRRTVLAAALTTLVVMASGLVTRDTSSAAPGTRTLVVAGYTTPREVYNKEVFPAFKKYWQQKTGQEVKFEDSWQGSGAQSRAVIAGLEADVVVLSLDPDVEKLSKAGLITHDWRQQAVGGMVSRSVVALAVRKGNPKGIKDFSDLTKPGLNVLTPNVRTSGGAMWNVAAIYGSGLRGAGNGADAATRADALLKGILTNVTIMDKGARESMITFERGVGDVAITYENEILTGRATGQTYDMVIPPSTLLIENPAAVVDTYVDKHGSRDVAEAFVAFLTTRKVQESFARAGYRSVDTAVQARYAAQFPQPTDLFTIKDLGGWPKVSKDYFGAGGVYDRVAGPAAEAR